VLFFLLSQYGRAVWIPIDGVITLVLGWLHAHTGRPLHRSLFSIWLGLVSF
jgi:hypothetical protein